MFQERRPYCEICCTGGDLPHQRFCPHAEPEPPIVKNHELTWTHGLPPGVTVHDSWLGERVRHKRLGDVGVVDADWHQNGRHWCWFTTDDGTRHLVEASDLERVGGDPVFAKGELEVNVPPLKKLSELDDSQFKLELPPKYAANLDRAIETMRALRKCDQCDDERPHRHLPSADGPWFDGAPLLHPHTPEEEADIQRRLNDPARHASGAFATFGRVSSLLSLLSVPEIGQLFYVLDGKRVDVHSGDTVPAGAYLYVDMPIEHAKITLTKD